MNMRLTVQRLAFLLGAVLLLRLLCLGWYPLMDTSEARYGEMARKMLESGNWLTPMFDDGVPFWGKPPLSFWTQAAGMKLFGVNPFGARLASWLLHAASCGIIVKFVREERDLKTALLAAVIYASCALGVVVSGVVLTDPALSFSVMLALYGFWRALAHGQRSWGYIAFVAVGLGLLAKGPLMAPLIGLPVLAWALITRKTGAMAGLPWLSGIALMLAIALPWYLLAEQATPGFLRYFILGEHGARFLIKGWRGDLYGTAHARPLGAIWLQLLLSLMPWSVLLPLLIRYRDAFVEHRSYYSYVVVWALTSPLFFTMSGNILWTYVLPALPAWAMLLADGLMRFKRYAMPVAWVCGLMLPLAIPIALLQGELLARVQNQAPVVVAWKAQADHASVPLYYLGRRSFAAVFYSAGQARYAADPDALPANTAFYLARSPGDVARQRLPTGFACNVAAQLPQGGLFYCQARR